MKVFFVSAGDYSDYSIYGVFSTKEKAQNFIDGLTTPESNEDDTPISAGDRYHIEEWDKNIIWARDKEHAQKIAVERMQAWLRKKTERK